MTRHYLLAGAVSGFLAVGLSAFGAHALKGVLTGHMLDIYHTGAEYQMTHSLMLVLTAILTLYQPESKLLPWAARFFIVGIVLFSGSLYVLSLTEISWLGAITPIGGVSLMLGWLMLAVFAAVGTKISSLGK